MEELKHSPILLGCLPDNFDLSELELEINEEAEYADELLRPNEVRTYSVTGYPLMLKHCKFQVVIADDARNYQNFSDVKSLFYAPKELEGFYEALGCPPVSTLVTEEYHKEGEEVTGHRYCTEVRDRIFERFPLFLHAIRRPDLEERFEWLEGTRESPRLYVHVYKKVWVTKILRFGEQVVQKDLDISAGYWGTEEFVVLLLKPSQVDYFE